MARRTKKRSTRKPQVRPRSEPKVAGVPGAAIDVTTDVADGLYTRVALILEHARAHVARTVNITMVSAYWLIGREIIVVEQGGAERAAYGAALIENLAQRLTATFGKGYGRQNLRYMRSFYLAFPTGSALPEIRQTTSGELAEKHQTPSGESEAPKFSPALSWTHYLILSRVANPKARAFYEIDRGDSLRVPAETVRTLFDQWSLGLT